MTSNAQETYLSDITEQLVQSWSKLGAQVGWCMNHSDGELRSIGFDPPIQARDAIYGCLEKGCPILFNSSEVGNGIAVPVFTGGRCAGAVLCLLPLNLTEQSQGLFEIFLKHLECVQATYQNESDLVALSQELSGSYEELSLIYKLGQDLHITDDPGRFIHRFADDLLELIHAQGLVLFVNHRLNGGESSYEIGTLPINGEAAKAVARYLYQLIETGTDPLVFADISAHPALVQIFRTSDVSILAWPLQAGGDPLGVLFAVSVNQAEGFDSTDAKLLGSIAEHTASFLQNRFLLADIQDLLAGLLTSLVNAIDAKDPYTRGHSHRVALIGQRIAQSMGLPEKECAKIYMAGLLHDIGKIGVSDQVLSKPGKLTREEYATVQEHPVIGSRIIASVRQLRNILPGILNHHERYDGKGYSEGLAGEQIPTMGMIVGLADSFDAITSERTYHAARSFSDAIKEVCQCSGTQFAPAVVRGLLDCDLEKLEKDRKALADRGQEVQILSSLNWFE